MAPRSQLQTRLEGLSAHVYFQPPVNTKMQYPCIRYMLDGDETLHAGNKLYRRTKKYQVTVIDRNPDSTLPDVLMDELPLCTFDRFFTADQLNHYVFTLFF
jgi:hypothetical protein